MTEAQYQEFVNSPDYARWSALHQRHVEGEALTEEEQAFYDAVNARLDEQEESVLNQTYLIATRQLRQSIAATEQELERLQKRQSELKE
jgi:DNA replication initiation complex subunit (GINS family)